MAGGPSCPVSGRSRNTRSSSAGSGSINRSSSPFISSSVRSSLHLLVSPAAPPNGRRSGGSSKRTKRAGDPQPRVLRGGLLLERQRHQIEVDSRCPPCRVAAEHNSRRANAKRGEVHPEDVGVLLIVRVQGKAPVQRGEGAQTTQRQLTSPDEDLGSSADHHARAQVGERAGQLIPPAQIAPDRGVVRHIGP